MQEADSSLRDEFRRVNPFVWGAMTFPSTLSRHYLDELSMFPYEVNTKMISLTKSIFVSNVLIFITWASLQLFLKKLKNVSDNEVFQWMQILNLQNDNIPINEYISS